LLRSTGTETALIFALRQYAAPLLISQITKKEPRPVYTGIETIKDFLFFVGSEYRRRDDQGLSQCV
jgi:hypothetical protein